MITISLCMIVKNEEDVISRCLDSVKDIVDEIVIVDTGSEDNTKEVAKGYTDKIYDFKWIDDFAAARNFAFSKGNMEYLMWLDADDVIAEEDRVKFKKLKETLDPSVDVVMMKYATGFDEHGNVNFSYYRGRLFKRSRNPRWHEPVHEYCEVGGNIINSDIHVTHRKMRPSTPGRNIRIYESLMAQGKQLSTRGTYYYARELYQNGIYDKAIIYYSEFLDSEKGWVEDNICACNDLAACYQRAKDNKKRIRTLLRSFEYDSPRAEICCQLGNYYFEELNYSRAIFWYDLATKLQKPERNWGFIMHDYWGFIPNIQLCVCYDRIGNTDEAIKYNDKAAEFKPNAPSVIYNRKYFESKKAKSEQNTTG